MRVCAAAMLLIAGMAGQGIAAASSPAVTPEDAHAGCVRTDLRACMISLGSAFWFDMNLAVAQIARRNELDVNGRTAHRQIVIDAKLPHRHEQIGITLTLGSPAPNDQVVKVEVTLPEDPELAHTASDYDKTQLYDVVSVVLGNRCPNLDKLMLYRFYENSIKPRETPVTQTGQKSGFDDTKQTMEAGPVPFCGTSFRLHREAEWYGPPDIPERPLRKALKRALSTIEIE